MNSRARFSFGALAVLSFPSSQTSIAGSMIMRLGQSVKEPSACRRKVSFWAQHQRRAP